MILKLVIIGKMKIINKLKKLITFKGRYLINNYLFIRSKYWFGIVKHNVNCPNIKYKNTTYIFCKWNITKIK
jgi:hypothetical protein